MTEGAALRADVPDSRTLLSLLLSALLVGSSVVCVAPVQAAAAAGSGSGTTLVVDADGSGDYTAIQAAVDNASAGDTIEVNSGTYEEDVNVDRSLTLVANGTVTVVPPNDTNWGGFRVVAADTTIDGFTVTDSPIDGVVVAADNVTVRDVTASNASYAGVRVAGTTGTTVESLSVVEGGHYGVQVYGDDVDSEIRNVRVQNATVGIYGRNVSEVSFRSVTVENSSGLGMNLRNVSDSVVVDATVRNGSGDGLELVHASNVTLRNVSVYAERGNYTGVDVRGSTAVSAENVSATGYNYGIVFYKVDDVRVREANASANEKVGMVLQNSSNGTVAAVRAFDNGNTGVSVYYSDAALSNLSTGENSLFGLTVAHSANGSVRNSTFDDDHIGQYIYDTENYTFRNNSIRNANYSLTYFRGPNASYNDIDTTNTVDGDPIYHFTGTENVTVDAADDPAQVLAVDSTNVTVRNATMTDVYQGVGLWNSSAIVENVSIEQTGYGLYYNDSTGTISDVSVNDSVSGLLLQSASHDVDVTGSSFTNVRHAGVELTSAVPADSVRVANSTFDGTGDYAVWNKNDSSTLDARHNWWGVASGPNSSGATVTDPVDDVRAVGQGGNVSENVRFSVWSGVQTPSPSDNLVKAGENVTVSTGVFTYHADLAAYTVEFTADGSTVNTTSVATSRGEFDVVETNVSFENGGVHTVGVGPRQVNVTVDAAPPTVATGGDRTVTVGETVRFDASDSTDDAGIESVGWTFGDDGNATGANVAHSYDSTGTYTASVTVTDLVGRTTTEHVTVTVEAEPSSGSVGTGDDGTGGDDGSSGGGQTGDGAEADVEVTDTDEGATISVRNAVIGASFDANVSGTGGAGVDVAAVDFEMTFDEEQFRVEVTDPTVAPQGTNGLTDASAVAYFRMDARQLRDRAFDQATVRVRLTDTAIPERSDPADVTLYRYIDGEWKALETTHSGDRYSATVTGFSSIAVGVPAQTGTQTPATPTESTPNATTTPADSATPTGSEARTRTEVTTTAVEPIPSVTETTDGRPAAESTEANSPGFGVTTAVLALFLSLAVARRRC